MSAQTELSFPQVDRRTPVKWSRQVVLTFTLPGDTLTAGMLAAELEQAAAKWGADLVGAETRNGHAHTTQLSPRGECIWLNPAWNVLPEKVVVRWSQPFDEAQWKAVREFCVPRKTCPIVAVMHSDTEGYRLKTVITEEDYKKEKEAANGEAA